MSPGGAARPDDGWIDVSRPIAPGIPVWPTDREWTFEWGWRIEEGASVNVGAFGGSTHTGTHAEAGLHVDPAGRPLDALPLGAFVGPAEIVDVSPPDGSPTETTIERAELEEGVPEGAERLLLFTGCDWSAGFPERFRALSPAAARWCVERGLALVGTDAPSVDPFSSESLDAHRALMDADIAILEALSLARTPPGRYELVALPLPLLGADAAPTRAIVRRLDPDPRHR